MGKRNKEFEILITILQIIFLFSWLYFYSIAIINNDFWLGVSSTILIAYCMFPPKDKSDF